MNEIAGYKLSQYLVSAPFFDQADGHNKRILYGTRRGVCRLMDELTWNHLNTGYFDRISEETLDDLIQNELLVPKTENELLTIIQKNQSAIQNDDDLYIVVQPTAMCQLGCGYCGQNHVNKRISPENQTRLIEGMARRLKQKTWKRLSIGWFGAEPLVAMDEIRSLTKQFMGLAKDHGADYTAKVVTNGVSLSRSLALELVGDLKIRQIEVTLDGLAEYHDQRRFTKQGHGSFERIYQNLLSILPLPELERIISIRCNVDQYNRDGVIPLIQKLAADGLHKKIRYFYWARVYSWGNDAGKRSPSQATFGEWELEWFIEMFRLGYPLKLIPSRKPITCMAVQPTSFLVDANGVLFNCTEVSYVPTYETIKGVSQSNRYALGTLTIGADEEKRRPLGDFFHHVSQGQYTCHTCRMFPVCGGACPKQWLEGNIPCPVFKFNIEQRLVLSYAFNRMEKTKTVLDSKDEIASVNEPMNLNPRLEKNNMVERV